MGWKLDPTVDYQQVHVQKWVEAIQQHMHAYLMEQWVVDCMLRVEPEVYPQVDVAALVAALPPDKDPKQEPRSADDILFEPIPAKEPEPVKDDSVLDDEYLYEGMSYMGSEPMEVGCGCDECHCIA